MQVDTVDFPDRDSAKSLRKALAIMEVVSCADVPPTVAEAAVKTGISRPTCYRIVRTLIDEGYLQLDAQSNRLGVGFSVLMLSASLLDSNRLRIEALPHLHSLSQLTGQRSNLGILHKNKVLYLGGVEKPNLPTIYSRYGKFAPAHCCSLGKAMLAYSPEATVQAVLTAQPLSAVTKHSITSMPRFKKELELTRRRGYAVDREEHQVNSSCVAVPIFGGQNRVVGAIGISGSEVNPLLEHLAALQQTSEQIAHRL